MEFIKVYHYRKGYKRPLNRWHDVKKELPDCPNGGMSFLVVFNGESGFMAVNSFYKGEWRQGTHGEGKGWTKTDLVTHWRELPRWPK